MQLINLKKIKTDNENIKKLCIAREFHIWIWLKTDDGTYSGKLKEIYNIMSEIDRNEVDYNLCVKLKRKIDLLVNDMDNEPLYEMLMDFRARL